MSRSGRFFLDTNIIVYALDDREPEKRNRSRELLRDALSSRRGVISYQVVQEFLHVALHKFARPMPVEEAMSFFGSFLEPIWRIHSSPELTRSALDLRERWQLPFSDALIVAAALAGGCRRIYSEDFQNGLKIRDLVIENPYLAE